MFITTLNCVYLSFSYTFSTIYSGISLIHAVLPFGFDIGLFGLAAYYLTRLRKPNFDSASSIFGPEPRTKDGEQNPEKVARCIAHRGAGLDAPENTMEAFKYCVDHDCKFVELDVRASKDGRLVLLHDLGLERLADSGITDVRVMDWDMIKNINIGTSHPNKDKFKEVHLCLLDDAVDYLLANRVKMIIDIKGDDQLVIGGVLKLFANCPVLYKYAAVTCFNPFTLYQIRRSDPEIVGALSYRPFCFSAIDYDAEDGPNTPRYGENLPIHAVLRVIDVLHSCTWRLSAKWCNVSAVLLHKDIVSPAEVQYWRRLGVRCCGWCVNRPVEKLYWRGVLRAPYLANTLMGEADLTTVLERSDLPIDLKIKEVIQTSFAAPGAGAAGAARAAEVPPAEPETTEKAREELIKVMATEPAEARVEKRDTKESSTDRTTGV